MIRTDHLTASAQDPVQYGEGIPVLLKKSKIFIIYEKIHIRPAFFLILLP